jgi:hypothetical protein
MNAKRASFPKKVKGKDAHGSMLMDPSNTSLSPVGTAVLLKQAGLLASGVNIPGGLPGSSKLPVTCGAGNSSVTVAGPRRLCTELPY